MSAFTNLKPTKLAIKKFLGFCIYIAIDRAVASWFLWAFLNSFENIQVEYLTVFYGAIIHYLYFTDYSDKQSRRFK